MVNEYSKRIGRGKKYNRMVREIIRDYV